ncbi:TOMM system kinase/cyclase fusion protein [Chondromyces apiculatus]|uniref:Adenylate cyclase n=1 Tax=Chondromyces apiculatus DSM 436 TaxID=1192034 RepID=A0A017TCY7_9BACT|nr:TOMM system kinase/cyclase fusion protein [Chondromyces apiculatus]EYF06486.1 Adenylate cyclase [Chondromyces apiculatus DSM 436]
MPRHSLTFEPGHRFEGRYEIIALLGEGGFGTVFKARQDTTGQPVALKIMRRGEQGDAARRERRVARFLREAELCAQIHHPNTVQLLDVGRTQDGLLYTVFAFAPGETLAELLAREGRLAPREAQHLMLQVLDALACAHTQGVVHRDLKPSNIMIIPSGARRNAVVLDFGISVMAEEGPEEQRKRLTASDETVGTPGYAAPEQLRGLDTSHRADLFSWGLVFLECLTGQPVYRGRSAAEILYQQLSPEPVPLPAVLDAHPIGRMLRRVTRKNEAEREGTAASLFQELDACDLRGVSYEALILGDVPLAGMEGWRGTGSGAGDTGGGPATEIASRLAHLEGEQRQVTAVCCVFSPRADAPHTLDVEEIDERLRAALLGATELAVRMRALVAAALGDRLLLYFGYPRAAEDDAIRAAHAALAIQEESARSVGPNGARVEVQVGIHTGILVAGRGAVGGGIGVGTTAAIAERLARRARPGSPLVSADAQQLLRATFTLEVSAAETREAAAQAPRDGLAAVGGLVTAEDPGTLDDLVASREVFLLARSRGDITTGGTPEGPKAPLVGRDQEVELLLERFRRARAGSGQCSLITGEPGIGKTRLVRELRERLRGEALTFLEARCSPDAQNSALYPFIELLGRAFGLDPEAQPGAKIARVEVELTRHGFTLTEVMPLFLPLLSLPLEAPYAPLVLAPQRLKELTHNAVLALFASMAEERPLVLLVEDLHWADPSTIELLKQLVQEVPSGQYCVLLTARPEFSPSFATIGLLQLHLNRLGQGEIEALVQGLLGHKPLPPEVMHQVVGRTDGVPLFVEELTRMMVDSGALVERADRYDLSRPLSEVEVPNTLRALLTVRLDLLGSAKETAQLAAALGREFGVELLTAASRSAAETVREDLDALARAGVLSRKHRPKEQAYTFKHALMRDAAYESLSREARKKVHGHIARTLESRFPAIVEARPDLLARHHAAADQKKEAIAYAQRATQGALHRSAYLEAIRSGQEALGWISAIEGEVERSEVELSLCSQLTFAMLAHGGVGAPDLARTAQRSLELVDSLGDSADAAPTLWRLLLYYLHVRPQTARAVAERLLARAQRRGDVGEEVAVLPLLGQCLWLEGRFPEARVHLERALALYDPAAHRQSAFTYGIDSRVCAHVILSLLLWFMGYPDQALAQAEAAVAWARELDHPICIGNALLFLGGIHHYREEREAAAEAAQEGAALARRYGMESVGVFCGILHAWATGDLAEGQKCLASLRRSGEQLCMTYWAALIADVEARRGNHDAALEILGACRERAEQSGEVYYLPEIHRLEAASHGAKGDEVQAEAHLREALRIARAQGARVPELRASLALGSLLERRGARGEAQALVRPAHGWFTEGLDAPEMVQARILLASPADAPEAAERLEPSPG